MEDIQKNGFPIESSWVSIQNVILKRNTIGFINVPKATSYNPFDYYYNPVPESIVSDILGKRNNLQSIKLYTLFASLDPENKEQILKWIYYFGVPVEFSPHSWNKRFSLFHIDDLLHEENFLDSKDKFNKRHMFWTLTRYYEVILSIQYFKIITKLITKQKDEKLSTSDLADLFKYRKAEDRLEQERHIQIDCFPVGKSHLQNILDELLITNHNNTSYLFDEFLRNIYPSLVFKNGTYSFSWNFSTLLSALYFMFSLDLVEDKIPVECQNTLCKRFFIPNKTGAIYCSDTCQNRAKQQRHRAKVKKVKEGEKNAVKD